MSTHDDSGRLRTETVRAPDPAAVLALPALFHIERDLAELERDLATLHYALSAHFIQRGMVAADDLALTDATGRVARKLDELRARVGAARRLAGRGL